jgi:hypothetical protein
VSLFQRTHPFEARLGASIMLRASRAENKAPLPTVCRNDSATGAERAEFRPSAGAAKLFGFRSAAVALIPSPCRRNERARSRPRVRAIRRTVRKYLDYNSISQHSPGLAFRALLRQLRQKYDPGPGRLKRGPARDGPDYW